MLDLKDEFVRSMVYMVLGEKVYNVPGRLVRGLAKFSLVFAYLFCMNLPGYCLVEYAYLLAYFRKHVVTMKILCCPSQPILHKPHCVSSRPQVRDPELPAPAGLLGRHPDSGCRRQRGGRRLQLGPRKRPRHLRHSLPTPQPGGTPFPQVTL